MLRIVKLLLLFCCGKEIHGYVNSSWTIRENNDRNIPMPIMNNKDELIFESGSLTHSEAHQVEFFNTDRKPCVVPQELQYNSISRRKTHILGNGKVIVSLLNSKMVRNNPIAGINKKEWIISIIDPETCNYKHVKVAGPGTVLVNILPYENTFDILIRNADARRGPETTKVIRYTDFGEVVNYFSAVIPNVHYLKVLQAQKFDSAQGYYYIETKQGKGSSIIKKLDSDFNITNSYEFKHSVFTTYDVNSYSVQNGHFTICYFDKEERTSVECLTLDGDLKKQLSKVRLTFKNDVYYVTVMNFLNGESAVIYAQKYEERSYHINAQRIKKDGSSSEVVHVGDITSEIHDLYTFLKHDEEICVVVLQRDSSRTNCIKV